MGCRHHPSIVCAQFFSVNPDRRRRLFNSSPGGMYAPGCGLANVTMSWSAPEYLHMVRAAAAEAVLWGLAPLSPWTQGRGCPVSGSAEPALARQGR